jgi:hypothetical protein
MTNQKPAGGRPRHVAIYQEGPAARENFVLATQAILSVPKTGLQNGGNGPKKPRKPTGK